MLFLDLDNFKRINDSLGHTFGDDILQHFADVLRKLSRESDFCARISGDEFVVLIDEIQQPQQAQHFAARIIEALKKPIKVSQERLFVSASIGIAIYPDDGTEADLLLRKEVVHLLSEFAVKNWSNSCIATRVLDSYLMHYTRDQ